MSQNHTRLLTTSSAPRWAAPLLLVALVFGAPHVAEAQVSESDWLASSTLDEATDDSSKTVINLSECRSHVAADTSFTVTFEVTTVATPTTGATFAIKARVGSEACDLTTLSSEATDECVLLSEETSLATTPITETLAFSDITSAASEAECEALTETGYVYLIVSETQLGQLEPTVYSVPFSIGFKTARPTTPTNVSATAGESTIDVSWDAVDGVDRYRVYYSAETIDSTLAPEDQPSSVTRTSSTLQTSDQVTGIEVETSYSVAVTSVDSDANESFLSEAVTVETVPVEDFWEALSSDNPSVESGFCFIATAAYGSYQAPHVQVLRRFRDQFLLTHAPGRLFVDAYYALSPPLAQLIGASAVARAITRALLAPLYLFALVMLHGALPLLGAAVGLLVGLLLYRRERRLLRAPVLTSRPTRRARPLATAAALTTLALALLTPGLVLAQSASSSFDESPVDTMLEIKAGPYAPENLGATYDAYFSNDTPIMFEVEYDWQFYRGIGSAAIGGSLAFAAADGNGLTGDGSASVDPTSLNFLPLRLHLVYRFDYLALELGIPLTFYGKLGLDYYVWWITDGSGDTATNGAGQEGSGGTFGWHGIAGVAFLLDWLAPSMARGFDLEWGVNNSYLFIEMLYADVNNFGSSASLDLGALTFQIGLALEF